MSEQMEHSALASHSCHRSDANKSSVEPIRRELRVLFFLGRCAGFNVSLRGCPRHRFRRRHCLLRLFRLFRLFVSTYLTFCHDFAPPPAAAKCNRYA